MAPEGFAQTPVGTLTLDPAGGLPFSRPLCPSYLETPATPLARDNGRKRKDEVRGGGVRNAFKSP